MRKIQRQKKKKQKIYFEVRRSFNCLYFVRRVKKNEKSKEEIHTHVYIRMWQQQALRRKKN